MRPHRRVFTALIVLASACEFGERDVPVGQDRPVIHGVLNAATVEQSILVERTLTGRVTVADDSDHTALDPIASGGGIPISGARVTVTAPNGDVATALERQVTRNDPGVRVGSGVYVFANSTPLGAADPPSPTPGLGQGNTIRVAPGARYRLRVELPDGRVATGESVVPGNAATTFHDDVVAAIFNRDRDTLRLRWAPVPGARTYALRVSTPYGAFFFFSDSASFAITGELRNLFADRLPRVFQPGFTQQVFVAAVDTNYFDYYRSTNSPFTGSGIINHIDGGIGFFGAYVPIMSHTAFVRADDRDPIDGRYFANAPQGQEQVRLWVDSRGNGVTQLTGAYRLTGGEQYGLLGTLEEGRVHFRALDSDMRLVIRQLDGTLVGDTLRVRVTGQVPTNDPGTRVFIKGPPATTP